MKYKVLSDGFCEELKILCFRLSSSVQKHLHDIFVICIVYLQTVTIISVKTFSVQALKPTDITHLKQQKNDKM